MFLGRFVSGVKAVIPGIAGMVGMDLWYITAANVVSAFTWAAVHVLPTIYLGSVLPQLGSIHQQLMFGGAIAIGLLPLTTWVINYFNRRHS